MNTWSGRQKFISKSNKQFEGYFKGFMVFISINKFKGHRIWQSEILFGTSIAQSSGLKSSSASILLHDRPEIRYDILHVVVPGLF